MIQLTKDQLKLFYEKNNHLLQNKVIKNFLDCEENEKMLEKVLQEPTDENIKLLDKKFKEYFFKIKLIKYISSLIYYYTIDFDKRNNKRNRQFLLILDAPLNYDEEEDTRSLKDIQASFITTEQDFFNQMQTFDELLENDKLYQAYRNLTKKQQILLDLIYVHHYSTKEVAELYKETPQNISNIHHRALKKLKEAYTNSRR